MVRLSTIGVVLCWHGSGLSTPCVCLATYQHNNVLKGTVRLLLCGPRSLCRVLALFTKGFPTACLLANKQLVVHQKALKACHTLFDMEVRVRTDVGRLVRAAWHWTRPVQEVLPACLCLCLLGRPAMFAWTATHSALKLPVALLLLVLSGTQRNHNISYQVLREMVRSAAAEEQLMDARCSLVEKWIPVEVLAHFAGSLVEGMGAIMDSFTSDSAELREVIRKADAALASQSRSRGRSSGSAGGGGPVITPLNLKKQLYSIR